MKYPVPSEMKEWDDIDQNKAVMAGISKLYTNEQLKENYVWYERDGAWLPARRPTLNEQSNNRYS